MKTNLPTGIRIPPNPKGWPKAVWAETVQGFSYGEGANYFPLRMISDILELPYSTCYRAAKTGGCICKTIIGTRMYRLTEIANITAIRAARRGRPRKGAR